MDKIARNKILVEKYPFLLPRNRFSGAVVQDYDYSFTELDDMPIGWRIAFGDAMLQELAASLGDYAAKYRIVQIKEKFGGLRWYDNGVPAVSGAYEIIRKYQYMSYYTCINCGQSATKISLGWISPYCDACAARMPLTNFVPIKDYYDIQENGSLDDVILEVEES